MKLRVALALAATAAGLAACALFKFEQREPWRDATEARCLAAPGALAHASFAPMREIDGPGICGLVHPLKVSAIVDGSIAFAPAATLGCPMVEALQAWVRDVVQPAAMQDFGQPVASFRIAAAYGCRSRDNIRGAKLSEHAFGNALDIGAFILADGRPIVVKTGWNGAPDESAFLHAVHDGACSTFTTVLGPGADRYHTDHIHLDLAHHNLRSSIHVCQPHPRPVAPDVSTTPMVLAPMSRAPATAALPREPLAPPAGYEPQTERTTTTYARRAPYRMPVPTAENDPFAVR